jgi:hypothetical protein
VLLVEAAEMIRARRLIPLAVQAEQPVTLPRRAMRGDRDPVGAPLAAEHPAPLNYFGIWAPKGVPQNVVQTMTRLWTNTIANSQRLKDYANSRAALFTPLHGQAGA